MTAHSLPSLRRLRLLGKTILSVLMICCLTDVACSSSKSHPAYDVTLGRLEQIPPGTIIEKTAPSGWNHLIIKSYSRPGAGDVKQLSATVDRLTRLLFTAIVAEVKLDRNSRDGKRYKLAKVAVGLGTLIDGKDTVITPESQKKFNANLGLLARVVLRTAQERLGEIVVVARSATFLVFDSPGWMVVNGKHRAVVLRYALLVEERTGRLNTFVWALGRDADGKYSDPIGPIRRLSPNLTEACVLHVDGSEFSLGQPTEKAFAMMEPPRGDREIKVRDELKLLVKRSRFSTSAAAELETKLREALPPRKKS